MPIVWDGLPIHELVSEDRIRAMVSYQMLLAERVMRRRAPEIRRWMHDNAPWDDRTVDARNGLLDADHNGVVIRSGNTVVMLLNYAPVLHRGYYYAGRLEFDFGGKYQIVGPAVDHFAPQIFAEVKASRVF